MAMPSTGFQSPAWGTARPGTRLRRAGSRVLRPGRDCRAERRNPARSFVRLRDRRARPCPARPGRRERRRFAAGLRPGGTVATVVVGKSGQGVSSLARSSLFVNRGSAGLGIPRGAVNNLSHVNGQVAKSGFVELRPATSASAPTAGAYQASHAATSNVGMGRSAPPSGHASAGGHTGRN